MAKKIQHKDPVVAQLKISKSEFEKELKICIEDAQKILDMNVTLLSSPTYEPYGYSRRSPRFNYNESEYEQLSKARNEWVDYVAEFLKQSFDEPNNEYEEDFLKKGQAWVITGDEDRVEETKKEIKAKRDYLESMLKKLKFIPCLISEKISSATLHTKEIDQSSRNENKTDIFIVHGHDKTVKIEVARVLERLGLNPIILHEQPNKGRTIIEKFEEVSQKAGFAVILLTADDFGRAKKDEDKDLETRARQNVVLEMGYFIGKLGRSRVMALLEEGVEKPGDLDGIVYTQIDRVGNWKYELVDELKEAGYPVSKDDIP